MFFFKYLPFLKTFEKRVCFTLDKKKTLVSEQTSKSWYFCLFRWVRHVCLKQILNEQLLAETILSLKNGYYWS